MVNGADVIPSHVGLLEESEPSFGVSAEEGLDDAVRAYIGENQNLVTSILWCLKK